MFMMQSSCMIACCTYFIYNHTIQLVLLYFRKASLVEKIFSVEIIIVGLIGGAVATYSAIRALADPDILIPPCYVNLNVTGS